MISANITSGINRLGNAVNQIKGLSYAFDGATGLLNSATVESYARALEGLSLKQAQIALSTKSMTATQKEQILVAAGLKASTDAIGATDFPVSVSPHRCTKNGSAPKGFNSTDANAAAITIRTMGLPSFL